MTREAKFLLNCLDCPHHQAGERNKNPYTGEYEIYCGEPTVVNLREDCFCGVYRFMSCKSFFPSFCPIPKDYSPAVISGWYLRRRLVVKG
jgi:hypothetical protein